MKGVIFALSKIACKIIFAFDSLRLPCSCLSSMEGIGIALV